MRIAARSAISLLALLLPLLGGCKEEAPSPRGGTPARSCEAPDPASPPELADVPESLVLPGATVSRVIRFKDGVTFATTVKGDIRATLEAYKESAEADGFAVIGEDYEGIEAEVYLERGPAFAAVSITRSSCPDASLAHVRLVGESD